MVDDLTEENIDKTIPLSLVDFWQLKVDKPYIVEHYDHFNVRRVSREELKDAKSTITTIGYFLEETEIYFRFYSSIREFTSSVIEDTEECMDVYSILKDGIINIKEV